MYSKHDRIAGIARSLLLFLAMAACGDATASGASSDEDSAAAKELAQSGAATEKCPYLSAAQAEDVLGYPVALTSVGLIGYGKCEFAPSGGVRHGSGELVVMVLEPLDPVANFADTRETAGEVEEIANLGEEAFLAASELWVRSGRNHIAVRVEWYGDKYPDVRKADIEIARIVLSNL